MSPRAIAIEAKNEVVDVDRRVIGISDSVLVWPMATIIDNSNAVFRFIVVCIIGFTRVDFGRES